MEPSVDSVSETWPFTLVHVRTFALGSRSVFVFEFEHEGLSYFAVDGASLAFYPAAGMNAVDLEMQIRGAAWIREQDPVDSNSSVISDESVPPAVERRSRLQSLAIAQTGREDTAILEGLFLRQTGTYLALAQTVDGAAVVVSERGASEPVPFPTASSWRRLSYAIGRAGGLAKGCS